MAERILVPFEGDGAGSGELAWGQLQVWQAMVEIDSSLGMGAVVPFPDGRTVEELAGVLRFWMSRYAALRTQLRFDPGGGVTQVVAASGRIPLHVVDAGDADPAAVADRWLARWREVKFDYADEWPIRMAVVTRGGVVTHSVSLICHLAGDAGAVAVMTRELLEQDGSPGAPYAAPQPLELARRQGTPAARRHTVASMRYWEAQLRAVPARRFGPPEVRDGARYRRLVWDSPAMYLAARRVAARAGVDAAPVLLAAFAIGLGRVTGVNPFVAQVIVGNRFRPGLADVVSPLTQNGLCVLDVADVTVEEAVGRARRASLSASKNAYYHPDARTELIGRVGRERGEPVDLGCFYNDRRIEVRREAAGPPPTDEAIRAALPRTAVLGEVPMNFFNERLMVNIEDVPGTVRVLAEVDTRHLPMPDLTALLGEMEAAAIEAAADPTATTRVPSVPPTGR